MNIQLKSAHSFCQLGRRSNQEDARYPDTDTATPQVRTFVVCDGVGGQDKGEVASRTVADAVGRYMAGADLSRPFDSQEVAKLLDYTYSALDKELQRVSRQMATTLTMVCFHAGGALCAHIGDSRIYQVRPGVGIMYQSSDHSLVNEMVHSGNLTPQEAIDHPRNNVITRSIGYVPKGAPKPSASVMQIEDIQAGDYFFLCSDGVLHCVESTELFTILSSPASDNDKMALIASKCTHSSDNNTAWLIPIDNVTGIVGTIDLDNEDSVSEHSDTTTTPIETPCPTLREVSPIHSPSNDNPLSRLFKKIFK